MVIIHNSGYWSSCTLLLGNSKYSMLGGGICGTLFILFIGFRHKVGGDWDTSPYHYNIGGVKAKKGFKMNRNCLIFTIITRD